MKVLPYLALAAASVWIFGKSKKPKKVSDMPQATAGLYHGVPIQTKELGPEWWWYRAELLPDHFSEAGDFASRAEAQAAAEADVDRWGEGVAFAREGGEVLLEWRLERWEYEVRVPSLVAGQTVVIAMGGEPYPVLAFEAGKAALEEWVLTE